MQTIWKFTLAFEDRTLVQMPAGAQPLTVQMQGDLPCLWAIVDPGIHKTTFNVFWRGTGYPFDGNEGRYLGTVQHDGLVFHAFWES